MIRSDIKNIDEIVDDLESNEFVVETLHLIAFYPESLCEIFVKDVKDIYILRNVLKQCYFNDFLLQYLTTLIIDAVENSIRFRQAEVLKVVKFIMRTRNGQEISQDLMQNLFQIYSHYILSSIENENNAVNTLLKDVDLGEERAKWLVRNCEKSSFVLNRVLRYPVKSASIQNWCKSTLASGKHVDRASEIASHLIPDFDIVNAFLSEEQVLWAIFYSPHSLENKIDWTIERAKKGLEDSLLELARRYRSPEIVRAVVTLATSSGSNQ
ncbi:hypothetical protein [Deinococcus radiopugnans]|uniref:hypothetical protein n=1 Tax=Deinococcus radiopugnans TaxID=57497 RepID=UPI0012E0AC02|nr:hypothetical protein [Deinococcus radiopugnans]